MVHRAQYVGLPGQGAAIKPPEHIDLTAEHANKVVVAAAAETWPLKGRYSIGARLKLEGAIHQASECSNFDGVFVSGGGKNGLGEARPLAVLLVGRDRNRCQGTYNGGDREQLKQGETELFSYLAHNARCLLLSY